MGAQIELRSAAGQVFRRGYLFHSGSWNLLRDGLSSVGGDGRLHGVDGDLDLRIVGLSGGQLLQPQARSGNSFSVP